MSTPPHANHVEAAFRREARALFAIAYRLTGMVSEAEDIVQETFVRALASPPPDRDAPLGPWLTRVAVNLGKDALRRRKRRAYFGPWLPEPLEDGAPLRIAMAEDAPDLSPGPEARYALSESASYAFLCALEALTPRERTVLVLRDVMGLDGDETAQMIGLSAVHVRVVHHRARAKLTLREDELRAPDAERRERTMRALVALIGAIGAGEADAVMRLLSDDCVLETDAAGQFHAIVVRVTGKERIALTQLETARHLVVRASRLTILNGLPALVLDTMPSRKRQAPRSVLLLDVDRDGRIRAIRSVLTTHKLGHVGA
ncbi:MAG: sigma-70 family RNA polymerase sigma factor [Sandaracinaceae bacterium]|nr:sigma-70 family RNA polymerase sigma factor [Sandaracinaceae bacterium]